MIETSEKVKRYAQFQRPTASSRTKKEGISEITRCGERNFNANIKFSNGNVLAEGVCAALTHSLDRPQLF
jgi:hypothetical protein